MRSEGSMGEWREELELQRCSLALIAMGTSAGTGQRSGWAVVTATWLPIWAQVAKAHALQSIALQAPRDVGIRAALYEVNITQVSARASQNTVDRLYGLGQWSLGKVGGFDSQGGRPWDKSGRVGVSVGGLWCADYV